MRKIAIANRKGGVGKTTTAVNLAAALALAGKTVLLIDTDTQGHCSRLLGVVGIHRGLAELIEGHCAPTDAVFEARPGLHLVAGGKGLAGVNRLIARESFRSELVLSKALRSYDGRYDYVIIDTAPGHTELSVNVLFYADEVIIPVSMEGLAVDGLVAFQEELVRIQEYSNVGILAILPTFVDGRVKKSEAILGQLREHFGELVTFEVRYNVALSEAPSWGKTIYEYAPKDRGAVDYAKVAGAIA